MGDSVPMFFSQGHASSTLQNFYKPVILFFMLAAWWDSTSGLGFSFCSTWK